MRRLLCGARCPLASVAVAGVAFNCLEHRRVPRRPLPWQESGGTASAGWPLSCRCCGGAAHPACGSKEVARDKVWRKLRNVAVLHPEFGDDFSRYIPDFRGSEVCTHSLLGILPKPRDARHPVLMLAPDDSLDRLRAELDARAVPYLMASRELRQGIVWGAADPLRRLEVPLPVLQELASAGPLLAIVTGVAAVTTDGVRLGKGHGYFDVEWALLSQLGLASGHTEVMAVAHDCQVVERTWNLEEHDVRVDRIVTPSRNLQTQATKSLGRICWDALDPELAATPLFQGLRALEDCKSFGLTNKSSHGGSGAGMPLQILRAELPGTLSFNTFANWVVPQHVMVGRYPLMSGADYRRHLEQVLAQGISTFVCLQAELPAQEDPIWLVTPGGFQLEGRAFLHYAPVAEVLASGPVTFLYEAIGTGAKLQRDRIALLVDDLVRRVIAGETLYIHCWGGRGRSGMVASCLLGQLYGLTAEEAMEVVTIGYSTRGYDSPHHEMTEAHKDFVQWFLGARSAL